MKENEFNLVQQMNAAELNEYLVPGETPEVVSGEAPLTDIGMAAGDPLDDGWDGMSEAVTMRADSHAARYEQMYDVALAHAGDAEAVKRVEGDALWGWSLKPESVANAENTEDVLGTGLARVYGTEDPGAVWDAMNASADYEYEVMPAWNTQAEGMRLVWKRFSKMVQGQKAKADAAQAVVNERLRGLNAFVDGKEAKRDEGGKLAADAVDDGELWKLVGQGVLKTEDVQRAQAVREFMQAYVRPLDRLEEMDERMRGLDGLRDEVYELIGEDKDTARLLYDTLMRWAGEQRAKGDTGAGDEFQVAVGKKFADWSRVVDEVAPLALLSVGAPGPVSPALVEQAVGTYERRSERNEKRRLSAGVLRAAVDEAMREPEGGFWQGVKNAPRLAARMAGESAPYLLPYVGAALGTADAYVGAFTSGMNAKVLDSELGENNGGWEGRDAMRNAAMLEASVQALVEMMPWSRVGGKGVAARVGQKMKAVTGGRYVPGAFTRALARNTQRSVARALVTEGVGNVVTEGVLEPIAQGALTVTAEGVLDLAGVEHGRSKGFSEAFAELAEIWEPEQLAGFLLFSAALAAPAYGQARRNAKLYELNVKKFAKDAEVWEAQGLSRAEAEEAAGAEDALERGNELVAEGWKNDPAGMTARMRAKHEELKAGGRTLVFAGVGGQAGLDAEAVKLLGEAWRLGQKRYHLPEVELLGDGRVKLTREEIAGVVEGLDLTLTVEQADAFLFQELAKLNAQRMRDWKEKGGNKAEFQVIQERLADLVDRATGDVAVDAAVAEGSMDVEAMGKGLPEDLQEMIRASGGMTVAVAKKISEWAAGRVEALVEGGKDALAARAMPASEDGGATLGELMGMGAGLAKRERDAGYAEGSTRTALHRRRDGRRVMYNGRSVLGSMLVHARGGATGLNAVEDVSEAVFDMMVQERAQVILENQAAAREAAGESARSATLTESREAEEQAWAELADVARKGREALMKVDKDLVIEEVDGSRLNTIEALSTMALSRYVGSGVLPGWMNGLQNVLRDNLEAAHAVAKMQEAMVALGEKEPAELKELLDWLDAAGVQVGKSLSAARADAVVERMREMSRWNVGAVAAGPGGAGGMSVSQAQEEVLEEEDEIQQNDKAREAVAAAMPADATKREDEEDREVFDRDAAKGTVPGGMRGVFVGDAAVYNAAGDFWCGEVEKGKLSDGTEQVKVGEKGKHGVIAGKELTGRFVNDTAPILVWKRRDGALQVISGRHRFAKLMEDESATGVMCYVYEESDERDEKWARMKDYEQNMRDDQADEVTCAVYARETGLTEAEMRERGLTRNGSRSKRGIFIGQHAREELWTRFRNGEIKPMDAELVCKLTATLEDQSNVAEIQAHCCGLLKAGKSWDYIGASVQLMASAEARQAEQMLLDLGADFTANLERMARWVELCRKAFREAIELLKDEKRRVKKGAKASRLGLSATMTEEKREEMLGDLVAMDAKFEMIGSFPELVAEAKMWDGDESKFADPVAMYLERVEAMQDESLQEEQARRAAEEATGMFNWSSSLIPAMARSVWRKRVAGKDVQRVVDVKGVPVDLAVSSHLGERGGDTLRRVVAGDFREALERWKQEALSVLQGMVGKKKWNDVEQHVRAGKATMDVVKRAIAEGKIAALPKQGVKVSDEELRELYNKRVNYFEKRKGEVLDLLEGVMSVRSVDESKLSSSVYFNTPYGKVRLSDHMEPIGHGRAAAVLDLRYDMSDAEVMDAADGLKDAQGGTLSWSSSLTPIYQANIIQDLRKDSSLDGFMDAVDKVELSKQREFGQDDIVFGELSDADVEKLMAQNPGWPDKYNLKGAKHSIDEKHIWHTYRGHCLDYYLKDDGLNLTYDDIRMIPDILRNYDSITPEFKDGRWGVVYVKNYSGVEYRYSAYISKPHRRSGKPQNVHLVTGWITKKAVAGDGLTPQQPQATSASRFHRTAIVTPMEEYIKQNYAEEAKRIALHAKDKSLALLAPNGKISNLTPVQWLAVRLQSFKDWFGDWENDPANASKVVYENGEPLVVYHGTVHGGFRVFDVDGRGKTEGTGAFFTSDKRVAEGYSANFHTGGVTPEVYACFLNIREPHEVDFEGNPWNRVPDRASGYFVNYDNGESEWFSNKADADFAVSGYDGKAEIEEDWEESPTLDDLAREVWENEPEVDGIIARNVVDTAVGASKAYPATDFIVASPNQIKSATDNRGTFDGGNPDITYSLTGGKNLAAVHSLSAEKFLSAVELGGMPMPSVAVTRLDRPYEWGGNGNIYLVGKPEMVDPRKGTTVHSADAWAGYIPRLVHKVAGVDDRREASSDLYRIKQEYQYNKDGDNTLDMFMYRIDEGEKTERYDMGERLRSDAGKILFAWQSGYRPRAKKKDAKRDHEWLTRQLARELQEYTKLPVLEYAKIISEIDKKIKPVIEAYYAEKDIVKKAPTPEAREKRLNSWVDAMMRAFWRDTPGLLAGELGDVENIGRRVLDTQANLAMLARYADKHKKAYEAWVEEKLNKWYSKERYIEGSRKEATLDNITRYMLSRKGLNNEAGMGFSAGQVRAARSVQMRSLEDIKERRDTLTDSATSNDAKERTNGLMMAWREGVAKILNRNKTWYDSSIYDDAMKVLANVSGVPSADKLRKEVKRLFRSETKSKVDEVLNDAALIKTGVDALIGLRSELEDYMEAIPQRAVRMDEWEYAVMPVELKKNKAVVAALREHGIKPVWHDGTKQGRRAALAGLVDNPVVSFSLTGAASRVLEDSGDEYVANRLREAWQKNLEKWSVLNAGKSDSNSAMRAVMEMEGLVKATYDVVEGDAKLGRLYMLQRWAMVYARMVESGEIPPKGALKGPAYEKFVERLTAEQRTEMRRGMSREQAEQLVRELGVTRLEGAMERVARECMRAAEDHLKQRETERVHRLMEAAWPKREEGKRSPRGKLETREYRRLEWIKKVMELSGEDKYVLMDNLKNEIEGLPTEMVGYEERKAELEAKLAALDPKQEDYVERKAELDKAMRELNPNEVGYEERKAELEDQMNWLHVFGGWAELDVTQARKAAKALEDLLLRGRTEWEVKLQQERERTRRVANEISAHFKTAWYARKMKKQKNEAKANTNKLRQVKDVAHVAMSYAQMMLSLRRKLGKVFCDRQRRTIAEAHRNLLTAQKDLQDWTQMELQKITGLTGAALEQWIASNNQLEKTGIMMRMVRTEKVEMTADEVKSLENMGAAEFDAWRAEELARMEDEGRYRVLPTWEEFLQLKDIRLLRKVRIRTKKIPELQALGKEKYEAWREKKLAEAKEDNQDETVLPTFEQLERLKLLREMGGSGISVSRTEENMEELETTKEAMLYAVLLFEQPDYEHLVEAHGLTGEDVDAMKKIIGPKLLRWGYAMRRHLSENGQMMAAKYEAWNGVPFGMRENYFRGVFEHNDLKPEVDIKEGSGAATLGGSKYSILIPRRYHRSQIDWLQGASQVFMMTMNEQNNYIHTQHITREWRQLLSNREFAEGLKTEIGTSLLNKIKLHLDVIDAAPRADAAISASARKITRGIMRALAMSALSFNPGSLIKQVSCLLNAIPGGYVPDKVVKQSGVYQVLTYSGIGAGDLIKGYAHVFFGHGAVSMKELVASNVFQSRIQSKGKRVADILMMPRGQKASVGLGRTADVVGEAGLELMDIADRNLNVVPAAVVADAVYRKLAATDAGKEAGDKWCREQAIEAAGMMLDLVAQPKLRTQKGLWASHGGWGGGLGDFLFMFRSEVLAKMGTYFAQLFSGQIGRAFAGYTSFGALAFLVKFMLDFVTGRIDGDDLDDEDDWKKMARKSLAEIALNDLSSIPAVGSGFELMKSYIGGTRYYTHDPLANILPINEMISKSKRVYKVAADDGLWSFKTMRALSNWAKACGCSSGLFMGTGSTICNTAMSIILGAAVMGNVGKFTSEVGENLTD